jgi:hypothetical protein
MRTWLLLGIVFGLVVAGESRGDDNRLGRFRPLDAAHPLLDAISCRAYGLFVAAQIRPGMTAEQLGRVLGKLVPEVFQFSGTEGFLEYQRYGFTVVLAFDESRQLRVTDVTIHSLFANFRQAEKRQVIMPGGGEGIKP